MPKTNSIHELVSNDRMSALTGGRYGDAESRTDLKITMTKNPVERLLLKILNRRKRRRGS